MRQLSVGLGDRSYPICIGTGLLARAGELLAPQLRGRQVMVVSNETVAPLYLAALSDGLRAVDFRIDEVVLPDGEQYKTLDILGRVYDALLSRRHSRATTVVALGGGVIGDMAGFAAATYQRGVQFVQVPTTLLAQVDSSVGGKTGVNHPAGKNMIGAFHQPRCVLIDVDTLATLPDRELSAGLAEVIKYGLIADLPFLGWLERHIDALLARDPATLTEAIAHSCQSKAHVVAADEREEGLRAILNLGHTFGHAIEVQQGYGQWLHGEAVAAGMMLAARLSAELGWLNGADVQRIERLLRRARLPVEPPPGMTPDQFMHHMAVDKKVIDGRIRLVLLHQMGQAVVTDKVPPERIRRLLAG